MLRKRYLFVCFMLSSFIGTRTFADTIEERVSRLETKVKQLENTQTVYGVYTGTRPVYSSSNDCSEIRLAYRHINYDFEFKVIKKIKCEQATYIIGTHIVPRGFEGAGSLSVDAFDEKDVILP